MSDKTYFTITSNVLRASMARKTYITDYTVSYKDKLPQSAVLLHPISGKENIFPIYRSDDSVYIIELPANVKTSTYPELTHLHFSSWISDLRIVDKQHSQTMINSMEEHSHLFTVENLTNGKIWITSATIIIALPIPPKELTRQYISNLI